MVPESAWPAGRSICEYRRRAWDLGPCRRASLSATASLKVAAEVDVQLDLGLRRAARGLTSRDRVRLDRTISHTQSQAMGSVAADPTIRRQVVAAARRVMATDAHAPVARIAAEAGVSRATLYRHFGSRDGLLAIIDRQAPPTARARILDAAQDLLVGTSLAELSMDDLARAAGVSRGTLYRQIPGKPALLRAMIETYSPFRSMHAVLADRADDPPEVVLPLLARAVLGAAEGRIGLVSS